MKNNIWTSRSGNTVFRLDEVIGFKYWPARNESVGRTLGGLTVILGGGKIDIGLDDGGEELFSLLKSKMIK